MAEPFSINFQDSSFALLRNRGAREDYLQEHDVAPHSVGYCAIALFRDKDFADYIAIGQYDDVAETETWTPVYDMYEMIDWMAGFTIEEGTQRWHDLHRLNRVVGKFKLKYGWSPDTVVEDNPSPEEWGNYMDFVKTTGSELWVPAEAA